MIYCSKGHRFAPERMWCTTCGEPNPIKTKRTRENTTNPKNEVVLLLHKIPADVKKRFKRACLATGTTMRQEVINFMDRFSLEKGYPPQRHGFLGEPIR